MNYLSQRKSKNVYTQYCFWEERCCCSTPFKLSDQENTSLRKKKSNDRYMKRNMKMDHEEIQRPGASQILS